MDNEDNDLEIEIAPREAEKSGALTRVRAVSTALSEAARRSRLSSRRAASLSSGGFAGRRGARLVRSLLLGSFFVVVVAPTIAALVYFEFLATNQYDAVAEFTVSAGESPLRDGIASLTGLPALAILQDTQIITNFIHSREAVDKLEQRIGLRKIYENEQGDFAARFGANKPIERFVKYWSKVSSASIKMPGGIVSFSVRAFTPEDAKRVADATIAICDELVNNLNARINNDAVSLAQDELQRASNRLSKALAQLQVERDHSGILETSATAKAIDALLKEQRTAFLSLSGAYETQLKYMNADTPQMRELKVRMDVTQHQITDLESQLTSFSTADSPSPATSGTGTVSAAMTKFGELEIEGRVAEQLYSLAAAGFEHARVAAEAKMIYLKVFVRPSLPQESEYPSRKLDVFLVAVSTLAGWGILIAIGAIVRNNMA